MIFVNPLVLVGLVAAVLPLLVHLFNFRRPRRLDYSSLALLQSLQRSTMQRMRIRNWLLLLLRTLALCAIIIVFARPTLTGISGAQFLGRSNVSMVLVLDASLSMMQRDTEGTRLDQAKTIAQSIVESANPGDELYVLGQDMTSLQSVDWLEEVRPTFGTTEATAVIRRAAELLVRDAAHPNQIVSFIGDLQMSTLADSLETDLAEGVRLMLVPVGNAEPRANVGIADVHVTSQIVDPNSPVVVEATIVNHGISQIEDYAVSLYLGDERVAQTSVALPPEVPVRAVLRAVPDMRGWIQGFVTIEEDGVAEDNRRDFTLNIPEFRDLLLIHGSLAQTRHVELALSLRSQSSGLRTTILEQRGFAAAPLDQYSAIFLISPDVLTSGEVAKLDQYVSSGGGLLIFSGTDPDPLNTLFDAFDGGRVQSQESEYSVESADFEHPLFEGVFQASERTQRLESVRVSRAVEYVPGIGSEQTLISLTGGMPLLQELRHDRGLVLFLAVAPELAWSDLPVRGLFVPLMYRAAHYLSASGSVQGEQLLVGHPETIRVPAFQGAALLKAPDGTQRMPAQRQVFGANLIEVESESPGIVEIFVGDVPVRLVSIGLDPKESRLMYATPDEARTVLTDVLGTPVEILEVQSQEELPTVMTQARLGIELWRHFLVLGLVLLAAEMLLAARWKS